jgi:adenosylcobinamide-GDP ribazoletransferase
MSRGGLRLAFTLLTAIPLNEGGRGRAGGAGPGAAGGAGQGRAAPSRRAAGAAMIWAPAVGLLLGAAAAGVLELAARWGRTGPLLAAVLAVTALALLTRGLHLDGLADLADGLGSRRPADQALAIMKRSDIGPFGVVTLVLTLAVQVAALAQAQALGRGAPAAIAAVVAGRLSLTWACRRGVPAARSTGLGVLVAGTVPPVVPAGLTVAALAAAWTFGLIIMVSVAAGLAVSLGLTVLVVRRLGGITGDVLGALAEVTAAVTLLVTAIGRAG